MSFKSGYIGLVGLPNAGKSTLLNTILKSKVAIVSPKAQTTRHVIVGIYNGEHEQFVFLDTPGFHQVGDGLSKQMVKATTVTIPDVDLIYFIVDGKHKPGQNDKRLISLVEKANRQVFLILNKIDQLNKEQLLNQLTLWSELFHFNEIIPISALNHDNVDRLLQVTRDYIPNGEPFYLSDAITTQSEQMIIAEIVREKVIHLTNQEVPHSVAVVLDELEFLENKLNIMATVVVDKDSQKGILIGKAGQKKNEIIKQASIDLRRLYQLKVNLQLFVKVEKNWRNKQSRLTEYGYDPTKQ